MKIFQGIKILVGSNKVSLKFTKIVHQITALMFYFSLKRLTKKLNHLAVSRHPKTKILKMCLNYSLLLWY